MTTKYRIIFGFMFMVVLLGALAVFSYNRLGNSSDGFRTYRSEARTAVNANAADALLREAKDQIGRFVLTLQPAYIDNARKDFERSIKYIEETILAERSQDHIRELKDQIAQIKTMMELADNVRTLLLNADKGVKGQLIPTAAAISANLTIINKIAASTDNFEVLRAVNECYSIYANFRVAISIYNATYQIEDGVKSNKLLEQFAEPLKAMAANAVVEDSRKAVAEVEKSYTAYLNGFKAIDRLIIDGINQKKKLDDVGEAITKYFDGYTAIAQEHMNTIGPATQLDNENAQRTLLTSSGIGILIGIAAAAWIIMGVVRVLVQVSTFAGEIAHGNFAAQLQVKEKGEIGLMVSSILEIPTILNLIAKEYDTLERQIEVGFLSAQADVKKFSGGFAALVHASNNILQRLGTIFDSIPSPILVTDTDLRVTYMNKITQDLSGISNYTNKSEREISARDDFGSASCALTNALRTNSSQTADTIAHPRGKRMDVHYTVIPMLDSHGKLASLLELVVDLTAMKDTERRILDVANRATENADRVAAASEELSTQVEQVSRGADMQRTRVESTATAMNEMNATVLEVARNAGNASEQTEATRSKATEGAELVDKVVKAINGVNSIALALQDNMKGLGQQAESIGGVMNVISDIADQTNLLALNAAIEAARAGEAGRGFAVVADEVRKLAEKTMQATQEVGANIQAIQNSARANISEVTTAVTNINGATELANASGRALGEIVTLSSASSSLVASIATAAEEQSATSE